MNSPKSEDYLFNWQVANYQMTLLPPGMFSGNFIYTFFFISVCAIVQPISKMPFIGNIASEIYVI